MSEAGTFQELPHHLKSTKGPLLLVEGEEGRISDVNPSMGDSFGLHPEQARSFVFDELFHSEKGWKSLYGLVLEYGFYRTGPLCLKASERKAFLNIHPLYIGEGGLSFAVHVQELENDPIPENGKEVEEDQLQDPRLLDYLDEVIYRLRVAENGSYEPIYISPRIVDLFGIEASDYLERSRNGTIEDLIEPEDLPQIRRCHRILLEEQKPVSMTYRITPEGDQDTVWIEEKIYPLFNGEGEHVDNMGILRDVTEQKVVERRLLQREKHFRNLFENNLAGVFRTDPERIILSCNDAFVHMLGYKEKDELLGKSVEEIYQGSTDKGKFVRMVLENDGLTGHESKVSLKDGRTKYFIENVTPIKDEEGDLVYIDGTVIDITELKEVNAALRESEERYRTLIDAAVDGILVWEWENGRIVNVNKSASDLLKRDQREIVGSTLERFFPEGKEDPLKEMLERSDEEVDPILINEDSALVDANGERVPVEVNARAFELKGQRYVIGLFRDISKWIRSQRELRDSEERFRLLSRSTIEGIVMTKEGRIFDINDQFLRILGYSERDELLGKYLIELVHPDYHELAKERLAGNEGNELVEAKAVKKDGNEIMVEAQGEFLPYNGEEIRVTVIHDITERKRVEEELRERERAMFTLLGNLPGIAYRCYNDRSWTMEFISQGCEEILGISPLQLIGNQEYAFGDLILEEDQEEVWNEVQKAISQGQRFDIQYRIRDSEGSVHTLWERGEAVSVDDRTGATILEGFITDISKRIEYEKELKQSQARYRDLIENSPYGTILHKDGEVLYLNDRAKRLFRIDSIENAPSTNLLDYLDPEFHSLVKERMERVKKGEDLPFIEVTGSLPNDQGKIDLETKIDLIHYEGKEVFHTAFRDISREKQLEREMMRAEVAEEYNKQLEREIEEHKETQRKLENSQEFTRSIIESSLDMIIATDKEGRITVFNDAAETEFGYSRDEVIGQELDIVFYDEKERERVYEGIYEGEGFTGEIWNIDIKGRSFLTYLSATILKDHNGHMIGSMGISRDITELKEAEEELRKSEEKYRAIYDQAYIGIAQVDFQGNFMNTNHQLCTITGYSEEELRNMNFQDITVPEDQERSENFRVELEKQNKDRISFEKQYIHKDGSRIDLNVTVALVKDKSSQPAYFVTVFEDITERKKNEKELIRSLKEKEILLREVHHRVKNNLQVISSILNLQSNFVEDPNTLQILRESQNRISTMSFIHESLYRTDEFDSIDLAQYVKELSTNLLHSYYQKPSEIHLEHDLEKVDLDLDQAIPCGLIINELVSNALKYAFPDGSKGKVMIGVEQTQKEDGRTEVRIRIQDDGVGLPESYEVGESDSLGLQLVSSLLEQIGGEISLKRDNGTEYLIKFEKH